MKTRADLHREIARAYDLIEGTDLSISKVTKLNGCINSMPKTLFNLSPELYEFSLAIVENKPVFKGDTLYSPNGTMYSVYSQYIFDWALMSWNPPKPRTVMLEVSLDVAVDISSWAKDVGKKHSELGHAAIKALKELKS